MPGEKGPLPWAPGPAPSPPSGTGPTTQRAGVSRGPAARETRRVCAHQGFLEIKFGAGVVNALEAVGAHVTGCASWRPPQPPPGPAPGLQGRHPQARLRVRPPSRRRGGGRVSRAASPRPSRLRGAPDRLTPPPWPAPARMEGGPAGVRGVGRSGPHNLSRIQPMDRSSSWNRLAPRALFPCLRVG